MKKILIILLCCISTALVAANYTPFAESTTMPSAEMRSVNQSSYMTTGSRYTSAVYPTDASSPVRYAPGGGRKSGFNDIVTGEESTDYDPQTPQLPIGDALLPLLLMALAMLVYRLRKNPIVRSA